MLIEEFKGFEIHLDVSSGEFSTSHLINEQVFTSTNLKTLKKKINEFIKDNLNFGAFKVHPGIDRWGDFRNINDIYEIVGSNKEGQLLKVRGRSRSIVRTDDLTNYMVFNPDNGPIIDEMMQAKAKHNAIDKAENERYKAEIEFITAKLKVKTLGDFLKEEGIEVKTTRY